MSGSTEPSGREIAIVGMAGRVPGARTLREFWRNLQDGVESIRVIPDEGLRAAGVPDRDRADPHYVNAAAVLDQMEWWDAPFWGFTPLDASIMDPQHRLFLECAWEACEDAGHAPEAFAGAIGVFAGCGMQAYMSYNLLPNRELMDSVGLFLVRHLGNDKDFLATRVSYHLNLQGPSVNVQTACSTSLVALHLASQSLLSGECDMALAGGVTVEVPHRVGYHYREHEILSPDGHCRPFDARAQGTVFGSGAGVIVLRRLADALRDGDRIQAVILGSAINNDGSDKVGYLAPSVDGQAASIVEALAIAGVDAETISYVETHGTGTPVGDPIEVAALTQAFRRSTSRTGFCRIGSLKSNIGHLDTAAGVASVIKTVLALQHRTLPASLHFERPNPAIDFASSPFHVNAALHEWVSPTPRRAGVNSLGVGGTNAHVVLEEGPERAQSGPSRGWQLATVSARTSSALDAASANLVDHLDAQPQLPLADVCFTLTVGRQALKERRIVVARDGDELCRVLGAAQKDRVFSDTVSEHATPAFLFAGGGTQFAGMGAGLYAEEPVYRQAIDACLEHLEPHHAREVRALLLAPVGAEAALSTRLARPALALPALFGTQYAMATLLGSWGIVPAAMIGHSMGEYTAAHLGGVFTLRDAVRLVALRGRLFETVPAGAMLSVPLSEEELRPLLGDALSLAAVNAPQLCVASGPEAAIARLERALAARGSEGTRLHIAVAAHSSMLEPILEEFGAYLATIEMRPPIRPFVSNLTGTWIAATEATDPGYWVRHLRDTVRFADGIAELTRDPTRVLVEVGPGRALVSLARHQPGRQPSQLSVTSMKGPGEDGSDVAAALTVLGRLWARGVRSDWTGFWAGEQRLRVQLPTYPWERQRHWIDAPSPRAAATPDNARRAGVADWFARPVWRQTLPPVPLSAIASPNDARVLVFVDAEGFGDLVAAEIVSSGRRVTRVYAGTEYSGSGDHFTIRPASVEDHAALLSAQVADGGMPSQVVFVWGVASGVDGGWEAMLERGFHALVAFAQAVAREDPDAAFTLDVVTNDLQRIGGEPRLAPSKALLLGPARVMPREFPHVRSRAVDVVLPGAPAARAALAAQVAAEVCARPTDETVAFRGPDRYVPELVRVSLDESVHQLRTKGVYLITGGFGGIGYALAEHLARTRRARLVLIGRSATGDRVQGRVEALEALGAEVEAVQADVTDIAQVRSAVGRARARFGVIHGVFHAAGTIGDGVISLKTREEAERVLAPKVTGTLALDEAIGEHPLDLFVVFSSISSVAGLAGQADYAAANAFLDAFAHERSARTGQRTVAIAWSAWKDVGMVANAAGTAVGIGRSGARGGEVHPLLGTRIWAGPDAELFAAHLAVSSHWVLDEHRLRGGRALIPGAGYLEIARAAVEGGSEARTVQLRDVVFKSPFAVQDDAPREMRVHVERGDGADRRLTIAARAGTDEGASGWQECVTATVGCVDQADPEPLDLQAIGARCVGREVNGAGTHPHLDFGPRWKSLLSVRYGDAEALVRLALPDQYAGDLETYRLHPALMDLATAGAQALFPEFDPDRDFYVPASFARLTMFAPLSRRIYSHVRLAPHDFDPHAVVVVDVTITDETGRVLVDIGGFMMTRVRNAEQLQAAGTGLSHRQARVSFDRPETPPAPPGLEEAITTAEGMQAIERIVSGPDIALVFATPKDAGVLIAELRAATAPRGTKGLTAGVVTSTLPVGEIEAMLATHEAVSRCAVLQRVNRPGERKLVAFVVFAPGQGATVSDLRRFLKARLPEHLVPSTFVEQESLPLRADGTVNGEALPDPFGAADDYVAPRTDTERLVAEIWKELLGVERVSVHDNFFDSGGHSLLAMRVVARIEKRIGARINQAVMVLQTLEQIAAGCDRQRESLTRAEAPALARVASGLGLGTKILNALKSR